MTILEKKKLGYHKAKYYLDNAIDILKTKGNKQGRFYEDEKYVRMASGTAYSGILLALDAYLESKGKAIIKKGHQRKSVDDYKRTLSAMDNRMLKDFINAYEVLHLGGYYDGNTKFDFIKSGMDSAAQIIKKIKPSNVNGSLIS